MERILAGEDVWLLLMSADSPGCWGNDGGGQVVAGLASG